MERHDNAVVLDVRNNGNLGVSEARKRLFSFANEHEMNFFCVVDSDDILHKNLLFIMYEAIKQSGALICSGDHALLGIPETELGKTKGLQGAELTLRNFEMKISAEEPENAHISWKMLGDELMVFREFPKEIKTWHSDGYLPVMARKDGNIPVDEDCTNLGYWIQLYWWEHERETYLTLVPKGYHFLYFYRLYNESRSHGYPNSNDPEKMITDLIQSVLQIRTSIYYRGDVSRISSQLLLLWKICNQYYR